MIMHWIAILIDSVRALCMYQIIKIQCCVRLCKTINFCNQFVHHLFSTERSDPLNLGCPFITCFCPRKGGKDFFLHAVTVIVTLDSMLLHYYRAKLVHWIKIFSLVVANTEIFYCPWVVCKKDQRQGAIKKWAIFIFSFNIFFFQKTVPTPLLLP